MLTIARQESSSSTEVPGKIPVCVVGSVQRLLISSCCAYGIWGRSRYFASVCTR